MVQMPCPHAKLDRRHVATHRIARRKLFKLMFIAFATAIRSLSMASTSRPPEGVVLDGVTVHESCNQDIVLEVEIREDLPHF
jgi:hypothetical protein